MTKPIVTAYDWSPDRGRGLVRDMRVRWALEEVGQPYDVRYLSWGQQKEPAHRARHPFGQVPTYEEDGVVLFESGAIVLHIAENRPGLFPEDRAGRARAIGWMFAALNTVEPVIWDHLFATVFEGDKDWSKARLPGWRHASASGWTSCPPGWETPNGSTGRSARATSLWSRCFAT